MLVHELIENLRRFPQNAQVFNADELMIEAAPYADKSGNTMFRAECDHGELPEAWRKAVKRDQG